MKYLPVLTALLLTGVLIWLVGLMVMPAEVQVVITSFEDCADAGYPVMESYPRQCRAGDKLFVENIANIKVYQPIAGEQIGQLLIISGEARVFESTVNYRVVQGDDQELIEGFTTADALDVGLFGPFEVAVNYPTSTTPNGRVEVFTYSARDGSEIDKVTIPILFPAEL